MAFGNPAERPSIPEPISRVVRTSEKKDIEEEERQHRMKLGVLWHDRKITTEKLHEHGVKLDPRDIEAYSMKREQHRAMRGSEEAGLAEEVFLEGADTGGMTKSEDEEPFAWFEDNVVAYPAHPHDDVLRGTDAVLMFIDPEDDRKAYPVAVDVTTDRMAYDKKFAADLRRIGDRGLSKVYWVETAGNAEDYFDEPAEGRVDALNLSVYLPKEAITAFIGEETDNARADRVMRNLGIFVTRQMQSELEALSMKFLGINPREARSMSREALLAMLNAPSDTTRAKTDEAVGRLLSHTLPIVWSAVDRMDPMSRERQELLPVSILERPPLPRSRKERRVA